MHLKSLTVSVVAAVTLSLTAGAVPAHAADTVTINKISSKTAPHKKSVTIKPLVKTSGKVRVDKKTLTVKKGKKTVAKNKTSAKLKAGTYKVSTSVRYRTYADVQRTSVSILAGQPIDEQTGYDDVANPTPTLGECTVTAWRSEDDFDFACDVMDATIDRLEATSSDIISSAWSPSGVDEYLVIHSLRSPVNIFTSRWVRTYSKTKTKAKTQSLKIKQGKKPAAPAKCATYKNFKKVKDGMTVSQVKRLLGPSSIQYDGGAYKNRQYKPCKNDSYFVVLFEDGYVWDKMYAA